MVNQRTSAYSTYVHRLLAHLVARLYISLFKNGMAQWLSHVKRTCIWYPYGDHMVISHMVAFNAHMVIVW